MNTMHRFALAAVALATVGVTGCTTDLDRDMMAEAATFGGSMRFDAGSGEFNFLYRYYPDTTVYQNVSSGTWFWPTASGWTYGAALPEDFSADGHYHLLELPTKRPYTEHFQVSQRYPDRETLAARALAYDLALGRRSSQELGAGDAVFATAPTNDQPDQ